MRIHIKINIRENSGFDGIVRVNPEAVNISGKYVSTVEGNLQNGFKLNAGVGTVDISLHFDGGNQCSFTVYMRADHDWGAWTSNGDGTHSRSCTYKSTCGGYEEEPCADTDGDHECDGCNASVHTWQVHFTENSLKAKCAYSDCTLGEVGVTLNAHSVTLPYSPFHATVDVTENFKEAFPGVEIGPIRYDYQDSEGVWHYDVDPIPANAKAGQYQAGVSVSGIPMGEDAAALSTNDGAESGYGKRVPVCEVHRR